MVSDLADCVIFMLFKEGRLLVEKRKLSKLIDPGLVEIPGGHMEPGEDQVMALHREMQEELALQPVSWSYVCTLLSQRFQKMHYYVVENWSGEIQNNEAEALFWIQLHNLSELELEMDRTAVREYIRLFLENEYLIKKFKLSLLAPHNDHPDPE
ncbi:NUDIX hydrolase [Adhaeribacter aquaticus]|uniref:NUDIX hydrolase n=1 Tax=Adhaeribacter aquaticus TaxID=299567 RepID=UPI0004186689|nr:NUDIX domain-containing protein [Adhaeribacter aquaticus]